MMKANPVMANIATITVRITSRKVVLLAGFSGMSADSRTATLSMVLIKSVLLVKTFATEFAILAAVLAIWVLTDGG